MASTTGNVVALVVSHQRANMEAVGYQSVPLASEVEGQVLFRRFNFLAVATYLRQAIQHGIYAETTRRRNKSGSHTPPVQRSIEAYANLLVVPFEHFFAFLSFAQRTAML